MLQAGRRRRRHRRRHRREQSDLHLCGGANKLRERDARSRAHNSRLLSATFRKQALVGARASERPNVDARALNVGLRLDHSVARRIHDRFCAHISHFGKQENRQMKVVSLNKALVSRTSRALRLSPNSPPSHKQRAKRNQQRRRRRVAQGHFNKNDNDGNLKSRLFLQKTRRQLIQKKIDAVFAFRANHFPRFTDVTLLGERTFFFRRLQFYLRLYFALF